MESDLRNKAQRLSKDSEQTADRNKQHCKDENLQDTLGDLYDDILEGFQDQNERSDRNIDYWEQYHNRLSANQFYNGTSQVFIPLVSDAINARKTRFTNQIFPQSGRYVEATTSDGSDANTYIALVEHYIRKAKLRTQVIPALCKCGDVEGQYTVYVHWQTFEKEVAWRVKKNPTISLAVDNTMGPMNGQNTEAGSQGEDINIPDPTEEIDDIEEATVKTGYPCVEVISDADLLVLPFTADSIEEAMECGGSVTILRRWSKAKIKQMIKDKEIDKEQGQDFLAEMKQRRSIDETKDVAEEVLEAAGIKRDARGVHALVYETWTKLNIDDKKRIYKTYLGGKSNCLSVKRNPLWSDNLPIISCPVEKEHGSFKGISKVQAVYDFQLLANDAVNQGMDSASYALMPIVMTDPIKNPRIGSMILSLAAIWETSPQDTQIVEFPELWKSAFEIVLNARNQVFQTLGVNPAMMTQSTSSKKPTQADIAQEQQVDILTTADAVTVIEEGILTPVAQRMLELDHQYRETDIAVKQYGDLGITAAAMTVPPIQLGERIFLSWYGVEAARNAQQIQLQTAAVNVLRGVPPAMYPEYELDLSPAINLLVENAFGARLTPKIFKPIRNQLEQNPELENAMMLNGIDLQAHRFDNHQVHMLAHLQALKATGDPHGTLRVHMFRHHMMMGGGPQMNPGTPGIPGGSGPGTPGLPGPGQPPRIGAQPEQATGGQNPPGMIPQDSIVDPSRMPR